MDGILAWLEGLPVAALYAALAIIAAVENVFPPIPADTIVAFGSFLAARGHGTILGAFLSTWLGNVVGAMLMFAAGRRYGAEWLHARLARKGRGELLEARLERMYGKYGLLAIFISRFLPGVRAIVPPFAGALKIPPVRAAAMIGLASGVWYGAITIVAYRLGENWERASQVLKSGQRSLVIGVAAVVAIGLVVWAIRRRRGR